RTKYRGQRHRRLPAIVTESAPFAKSRPPSSPWNKGAGPLRRGPAPLFHGLADAVVRIPPLRYTWVGRRISRTVGVSPHQGSVVTGSRRGVHLRRTKHGRFDNSVAAHGTNSEATGLAAGRHPGGARPCAGALAHGAGAGT